MGRQQYTVCNCDRRKCRADKAARQERRANRKQANERTSQRRHVPTYSGHFPDGCVGVPSGTAEKTSRESWSVSFEA